MLIDSLGNCIETIEDSQEEYRLKQNGYDWATDEFIGISSPVDSDPMFLAYCEQTGETPCDDTFNTFNKKEYSQMATKNTNTNTNTKDVNDVTETQITDYETNAIQLTAILSGIEHNPANTLINIPVAKFNRTYDLGWSNPVLDYINSLMFYIKIGAENELQNMDRAEVSNEAKQLMRMAGIELPNNHEDNVHSMVKGALMIERVAKESPAFTSKKSFSAEFLPNLELEKSKCAERILKMHMPSTSTNPMQEKADMLAIENEKIDRDYARKKGYLENSDTASIENEKLDRQLFMATDRFTYDVNRYKDMAIKSFNEKLLSWKSLSQPEADTLTKKFNVQLEETVKLWENFDKDLLKIKKAGYTQYTVS